MSQNLKPIEVFCKEFQCKKRGKHLCLQVKNYRVFSCVKNSKKQYLITHPFYL